MKDINAHSIQTLEKFISYSGRICIITHMKPDGDAIGSSAALYHFLRMCGKGSVKIILNDRHPDYLSFITTGIPREDLIVYKELPAEAETCLSDCDLIFCLDFNAFHRTDRLEGALTASKADKILIDHHLNPDRASFTLSFSETEVSSASEYLYQILMLTPTINEDARNLPQKAAQALMTGMTKSIALAGAPYNVRCFCVAPGPVLTREGMSAMKTLVGRAAQPQELVDFVLYLASDRCPSVTGSNHIMDCGRLSMQPQ
jgi:phosphoesterase RecJ-like protein